MKHRAALSLLASLLLPLHAQAAQADHVSASQAWIRLLPGDLPASGYVILQNQSADAATLTSAHSTAYASAMLHQSSTDHGMSNMTAVKQLNLPAHGRVALAPAGYHLMLEHASHPLKPGDTIDITLGFSDGSQLPVHFLARPANAGE